MMIPPRDIALVIRAVLQYRRGCDGDSLRNTMQFGTRNTTFQGKRNGTRRNHGTIEIHDSK